MHEHFDVLDAGTPAEREVLTGRTVVHRESLWDDRSRERATALAEYQRSLCPCGCGQPVELAWNPQQVFKVDHYTCYAARARAKVDRLEAKKHENAAEGWDDGRHSYVIPVEDERPAEKRRPTRRGKAGP